MSDKKHIDRIFQEKFKDFDVMPNDAVWEGIEARLEKKKKKQRIIPIWWQLGGVAAAIVLMFTVGNMLINNNPDTPIIVDIDKQQVEDTTKNNIDNASQKGSTQIASEDIIDSNENNESSTVNEEEKTSQKQLYKSNNKEDVVAYQNSTSEKSKENTTNLISKNNNKNTIETIVASTNSTKSITTDNLQIKSESEINEIINSSTKSATTVASTEKEDGKAGEDKVSKILKEKETKEEKGQDIEEAIAEAKKINEEEEKELRRWSISPNVAPVYFNSLGQGSSIDAQFNDNNTSSDISMSYGVKGSYAVNNRLKVTAGINKVSFNNTTNDVIALSDNAFSSRASNSSNGNLENVKLSNSVNHASLMLLSRSSISNNTVSEAINTLQTGNLEQRFGFIEIPLEVEYRLVDKKLGVNLSGGFSTLLLNENEIFADVNGQSTQIGEANNLRDTSFSANFGVGVDYSLTDKININLEPKFKYQINTFNNTSGDFRPFFIGVYTGLSFKF
ncbi:outer membrane beta-barrel protein [Winogradskyella haliclonae]|uniref:Outer membrane protein beta-barrel domain-containing protein n=1 Tax=Winogradskyella haliclonae TaxID=2048558 RepID=A0ABQ2BV86_9FLAO|nr:outer membrane beta-barrel protein [Winogradskyella haliclonae]GGI56340.1 hypothetical protein GCM10011444_06490 [Winogradskyella haliclonae]